MAPFALQAWSARQTKTHSPIIMQSVKSTQVQKPVLQTATEPATVVAASAAVVAQAQPQMAVPLTLPPKDPAAASSGAKPPPSYEFSLQQQVMNITICNIIYGKNALKFSTFGP